MTGERSRTDRTCAGSWILQKGSAFLGVLPSGLRKDTKPRRGARQLRPIRQIIESINGTLKSKLSLEHHGGHSSQGVYVRVLQRLLALTAAIWHNHHSGQPVLRSLTAYDH